MLTLGLAPTTPLTFALYKMCEGDHEDETHPKANGAGKPWRRQCICCAVGLLVYKGFALTIKNITV